MHVLIVGGTRYMGRIAVEKLLQRGDRATIFSRGNMRPHWWDEVDHIIGDRENASGFSDLLRGKSFDAVLDLQAYRKEHVETAARVLDGAVGRYLFVSTGSVYLDGKLDFATHCPFEESDVDWSDIDYSYPEGEDPYGVGKRHCEKWLQENSPVPCTIVRIPAVMGWDDPTARMWWWVQRALDGQSVVIPFEDGAMFRTLYSGDAAASFIRAIDSPAAENQLYHIAMEEATTIDRWVDLIWQAGGATGSIVRVPRDVIHRQSGLGEYAPPLSRSVPYLHDLSKAKRDFGFRTTPVAEWIQTTVDWYRENRPEEDSKGYGHRDKELSLARRWSERFEELKAQF